MMEKRRLAFDIDFNDVDNLQVVEVPEEAEVEEIIYSYTDEDMTNAYRNGFKSGREKGIEEGFVRGELAAISTYEKNLLGAFVKIYEYVRTLCDRELAYDAKLNDRAVELSMAMLKKILPYYTEKFGMVEMENAIKHILGTIIDYQNIEVFVSEQNIADFKERFAEFSASFSEKIQIDSDYALKEWECRVKWNGGGARWSFPSMLENIDMILKQYINSSHKELSE